MVLPIRRGAKANGQADIHDNTTPAESVPHTCSAEAKIRRGEIYLVSFDPTVGHEIKKTRAALIIQNDVGNLYSPLTIVAAITSKISSVAYPEVVVEPSSTNGLDIRSAMRLDQIRTVDRRRLIKRLGMIDRHTVAEVHRAIQISLGLIDV